MSQEKTAAGKTSRRTILKAGLATGIAAGALALPFLRRGHRASRRNVILIVCDAFRSDRVGLKRVISGELKSLTPAMDALAAGGVQFVNAKSSSSFTWVSMLSLAYDMMPTAVRPKENHSGAEPGRKTLPMRLKDMGYETLFVCANVLLSMDDMTAGFDEYQFVRARPDSAEFWVDGRAGTVCKERSGRVVNDRIMRTLDRHAREIAEKPLFLQVHYMDTHQPYNRTGYPLDVPLDDRIYPKRLQDALSKGRERFLNKGPDVKEALSYLAKYYDSATYALDRAVGALLRELERRRILDDALVILTADHGEEFADNAEIARKFIGHSGPLNEEQIHVPLILSSRGGVGYLSGGRKIAGQVSTRRVIRDIIDDYAAAGAAQYTEIRSAVEAGAFPNHDVVSALNWPASETYETSHIFRDAAGYTKHRLFYASDGELTGEMAFRFDADGRPAPTDMTPEMKERSLKVLQGQKPQQGPIDEETRKELEALGYLNR